MRIACILSFLALVLAPLAAQAQSFNCRYARTADEVLICQDQGLGALDERLSALYARVRNNLPWADRRLLEQEQAAWLESRRGCRRDAACIAASYLQRIRELQSY